MDARRGGEEPVGPAMNGNASSTASVNTQTDQGGDGWDLRGPSTPPMLYYGTHSTLYIRTDTWRALGKIG